MTTLDFFACFILGRLESNDDDGIPSHVQTWGDDPAERAHHIWEWWRIYYHKFVYLAKAVRLVVLVQVSSAPPVVRVFSQVKRIIDAIGGNSLHDNIETCIFERINNYDSNKQQK